MRFASTLFAAVAAAALLPATSFAQLNAIGEGRRAWLEYNCSGCHGNNGAGGMGPNIQHAEKGDVSQAMSGDATEGGMRSFRAVIPSTKFATAASNIAAYLATIGTKNEPTWLDWWNPKP
jgi:mono/diheme cytochrome c family protein